MQKKPPRFAEFQAIDGTSVWISKHWSQDVVPGPFVENEQTSDVTMANGTHHQVFGEEKAVRRQLDRPSEGCREIVGAPATEMRVVGTWEVQE